MINYTVKLNNDEFKNAINDIISQNKIDEIIETGTFHGDGSTKVFAETGKYVFTIECNYNNWITALNNLQNSPNVCVIHGLSMDREELIKGLLNEKFDIETTYDSKYPKTFYMREISQHVVVVAGKFPPNILPRGVCLRSSCQASRQISATWNLSFCHP